MREIKFRFLYGIDSKTETYFTKIFTLDEVANGDHLDEISDSPLLKNYSILERDQFTGLSDMNEVDTYERDIVSRYYRSMGKEKEYADVRFVGGCFCWGDSAQSLDYYSDDFHICGNIHQNPELLQPIGDT